MASFTDIEVQYSGVKPYALAQLAYEYTTESGLIVVDIATPNFIILTIYHFNIDNKEEFQKKVEAFAILSDAEVEFREPSSMIEWERKLKDEEGNWI